MRITACEAWPVKLTLNEPFSIAYVTIDHAVNVFFRIETDEGFVGFGCGAPDEEVTGETAETIERALHEVAIPLLIGEDPLAVDRIVGKLYRNIPEQPTAMAAVDMALFDILGKKGGLPLYRLLGGFRDSIPTSVTIGIQPVPMVLEKARMWIGRGFTTLKIKGGSDEEEDREKLIKLREAVGRDIRLFFDANQGYTVPEAKSVMETLKAVGAEFIEQPCSKDNLDAFSALRQNSGSVQDPEAGVPVMADESVLGPEDTLDLIRHGGADMYNIKLAKTGGILRAIRMNAVAAAAGAGTMVGCMDEAGLGVAAGLHVALSGGNIGYADLDGHLEFIDDPTAGAFEITGGVAFPSEKPGIGFNL